MLRPTRPPVLGGANRDPNEQKPDSGAPEDAGPEEVGEGDIMRVDTTLVSIPVSVMDRDGKFIPNLRKDDFHIWEDGVEQQVAYFASTEKPFTVALVIDTSGSTKFRLDGDSGRGDYFCRATAAGRSRDGRLFQRPDPRSCLNQPVIGPLCATRSARLDPARARACTTRWI